jgi:hypothetical protein
LLTEAVAECERVECRIDEPGISVAARLRKLIALHVDLARRAPATYAFAYDVFVRPALLPLAFDYRAKGHEVFHRLVRLIEEGQERGEFRCIDPPSVAAVPIAVLHMHASAVISGDLEAIPESLHEALYQLLMNGLEVRRA